MATTTTRTRKAAPKKDDAEKATPDVPENAGTDTEETETVSLLDERMAEIPEIIKNDDDPFAFMMAQRIVKEMVKSEEAQDVIRENTPNEDGIAHVAETSDNEEIVTARKAVAETEAEIARLQEEIEKARGTLGRQRDSLNGKAREVMLANMSKEDREAAEKDNAAAKVAVKNYLGSFKTALPTWENDDSVLKWVRNVNIRVNGAGSFAQSSTGTTYPKKNPAVAAWNERVREWARNNGIQVSPKGRLADSVKIQYIQATGEAPPAE